MQFTVAGALELACGGAQIEDRAFGGPQFRLAAAMLLVDRDRAWSLEELAAQLWPSGPPERWRTAVRGLVSRLRTALADVGVEGEVITNRSGHYHLELPDLVVDLHVAHDDTVAAARALAEGRHAEAGELAGRARTVLSRPILAGLDPPWVEDLRRRVGADHVESLLVLGGARRRQGRWAASRSVLAEALGLAPFREDAWRELMQVEVAAGNVATALQVYEDCRCQLADELGVDPSPATQALHTAILRGLPVPVEGESPEEGVVPAASPHALSAGPGGMDGDAVAGGGGDGAAEIQRPPYVGLRSFEQADADLFFGREAAVQRLVDLLAEHRAVTVVGPSGCGKSSLVRAGLLPALAAGAVADADTWPVVVMVPGRRPLRALADAMVGLAIGTDAGGGRGSHPGFGGRGGGPGGEAVRRGGRDGGGQGGSEAAGGRLEEGGGRAAAVADLVDRLVEDPGVLDHEAGRLLGTIGSDPAARIVVVVDQAEELFTVADPDQAFALLTALVTAIRRRTPRLVVVATMRADFYAQAASNPDMAALLGRSQLVIPPMSGAELEAAIVGPAKLVGATLQQGIVGRVVDDATGQPGRLPLLQHTLWELWHHRDDTTLTVAGYDRIGGLAGALARHAEQTWQSVGDPALARRILLRGVSPGDQEEADTRRPIHRGDLDGAAEPHDLQAVLEHLVSTRLLRAEARDDDVVFELAHEALITRWPRLHAWVAEQRAHLVAARALGEAADRWEAADRHPDWLLRGRVLADTVALRGAVESEELDLALSPGERDLVTASQAADTGRRAARRVERGLAAGRLNLSEDAEVALLLGLELVEDVEARVPDQRNALALLLHRGVHRQRLVRRHRGMGDLLAVSPGGELLAVAGGPDHSDPGHPDSDRTSQHRRGAVRSEHDGSEAGWDPTTIRLHRVLEGDLVAILPGHDPATVPRAAFSPCGQRLVSGDAAGTIRCWDVASATLEQSWPGPDGPVGGLDVAAGSGLVATWAAIGHDRQLVVCSADGERVHEWPPDDASAFEDDVPRPGRLVAFHPDGSRLLVAVADVARRIDLVAVATWQVLASTTRARPRTPTLNVYHEVTSLEWSRDGTHVAVAMGATTQVLDGDSLDVVRTVQTPTRTSVTWTPGGGRVVTAGATLSFLDRREPDPVSDTPTPPVVARPTTPSLDRLRVRAVPGSDHVLVGTDRTGAVDLHDVSTTGPAEVANVTPMNARGVAWSPDGDRLAFGRGGGVVAIVDSHTWEEVDRYQAHPHAGDLAWPPIDGSVVWSPDGRFVASTANDGTLGIRDLAGDDCVTVQVGRASNWPGDCDITADSTHVAAVVMGIARVVRPDGRIVATLELDTEHLGFSRLSADGSLLAIPSRGGQGRTVTETWTTHLWDWRTSEPLRRLGPTGASYGQCLSFHPDGRWIAFSSDDEVVRIVHPEDGRVLHELRGHGVEVQNVVHHPGGHLLASSGWDHTVRVWDLDRMEQVAMFDALTGQPGAMAFHPTRPWLAVADWSGVVRVWTLDFDELVGVAGTRVTRDLTTDERRLVDD